LISLEKAELALIKNQSFEILALELRDSMDKLGEIVGIVTTEDLLNKIFSDFCIGK
jgi:tRNA modification GTPase